MHLEGWNKRTLDSYAQKKHAIAAARRAQYYATPNQLVRHPLDRKPIKRKDGLLLYRHIVHASMGAIHGQQFMQIIRHLGVTTCLELGTCGGISSMFLYSALLANAKASGKGRRAKYIGIEQCPARVGLTLESLSQIDDPRYGEYVIHASMFAEGLPQVLPRFDGHLQFCYIDGHHLGAPTMQYFDQIAAAMKSGVICVDDISYNTGMRRAAKELSTRRRVQQVMTLRSKRFYMLTEDAHGKHRRHARTGKRTLPQKLTGARATLPVLPSDRRGSSPGAPD